MSISVKDISFSYKDNDVLKGVSFDAEAGEFISVLGPNGVGKSTLFKCILKLLEPKSGEIYIDETPILGMKPAEIARKIAYIPQYNSPAFNFSVLDMVLMGTTAQIGRFDVPKEKQLNAAKEAIEKLGITHLQDKGYANISGGERQLTLIARAIAQQAKILVMDEPSASLDFGNKIRLMKTIKDLAKTGYIIIQSTHDPEQAYFYSDKILAMHAGRVIAFGRPSEIVDNSLISTLYGLDVDVVPVVNGVVSCVPKDMM